MPLAGLMPLENLEIGEIEDTLRKAGCPNDNFEMTLSLHGLICLPQLHISNRGLIRLTDGEAPKIVDLIVSTK